MPCTGWDAQGNRTEYCDERLIGDAEGAAVGYTCGRALKPGNTSGKCEDHEPKAELRVEGSHAGAAHVRGTVQDAPYVALRDPRTRERQEFSVPDATPPDPRAVLAGLRAEYENQEREVARLVRARDKAQAAAEAASKEVTVAAHRAAEALKRYQEALRS